jgi:hypothetical protein
MGTAFPMAGRGPRPARARKAAARRFPVGFITLLSRKDPLATEALATPGRKDLSMKC